MQLQGRQEFETLCVVHTNMLVHMKRFGPVRSNQTVKSITFLYHYLIWLHGLVSIAHNAYQALFHEHHPCRGRHVSSHTVYKEHTFLTQTLVNELQHFFCACWRTTVLRKTNDVRAKPVPYLNTRWSKIRFHIFFFFFTKWWHDITIAMLDVIIHIYALQLLIFWLFSNGVIHSETNHKPSSNVIYRCGMIGISN